MVARHAESTTPESTPTDEMIEIASDGDLVLSIHHTIKDAVHKVSLRVRSSALKRVKYFERLLEPGRFGEGERIALEHQKLLDSYGDFKNVSESSLPFIEIKDIGRTSVKSIGSVLTDFFKILHGQDAMSVATASNLANMVVVADRFDATDVLKTYVKERGIITAIERKTTSKQEVGLTSNRMRQRLLVAFALDHPAWIRKYSLRLIIKGTSPSDEDADALWWDLPGRVEEELTLRRECVLKAIQELQAECLNGYVSRERRCRLGYDSSPQCDVFQLGEMIRFFSRIDTLDLQGTLYGQEKSIIGYEGSITALIEKMKQITEYQIDRNHTHCGIRNMLVFNLNFVAAMLPYLEICPDCWKEDRMKYAWIDADRGQACKRLAVLPQREHESRHMESRSFFMALRREWET